MTRQIVLDTETTGLSAEQGDRIVELGCVEMVQRRLTGNDLHLYLNPERSSHEDALKVHGITDEFLRDKPKFAECAQQILDYLQGAELIIHNASFDMGFLDMEFSRLGLPRLTDRVAGVIDTLPMAREIFPGKRNSLDALCERLGVDNSGRTLHGALLDAQLLADVYIHMTRGQESLLGTDDMRVSTEGIGALTGGDLSRFTLPVLRASAHESAAHDAILAEIDKTSGAHTVWRPTPELVKAVP